eukprot:m.320411 g.320411  ORF g.320411 m.320411 type:complete len:354 (+) comp24047_c0_seq1:38-1099(+)
MGDDDLDIAATLTNFTDVHAGGGYGSELEQPKSRHVLRQFGALEGDRARKSKHQEPLPKPKTADMEKQEFVRRHASGSVVDNAYQHHVTMMNNYVFFYGGGLGRVPQPETKTDADVIEENHRFVWEDSDLKEMTWEKEQAKKYYDKLFKEYCLADMTRYKENKIALRWRVEKEVFNGKGQHICGNVACNERQELRSWEVNFAYQEHGEHRNALVKLTLCPPCSEKLHYHRKKQKELALEEERRSREARTLAKKLKKERRKERKEKKNRKQQQKKKEEAAEDGKKGKRKKSKHKQDHSVSSSAEAASSSSSSPSESEESDDGDTKRKKMAHQRHHHNHKRRTTPEPEFGPPRPI